MDRKQFDELKNTGQLPTPSGVGMRILVLTQDENCALDDIVAAIQADPALTGRIIKLATSVQARGTGQIATAKEAAVRLGLRTVTNVALGFTLIAGNRSGRCAGFDYEHYWSWSLANAVAARILSQETGRGVPAEAFTCALLLRVGQLALASVHPSDYSRLLERLEREEDAGLGAMEREEFGIESREVAAALLEDWGLPAVFCGAVAAFEEGEELPRLQSEEVVELLKLLRAAGAIAEVCVAHPRRQPKHMPALHRARRELALDSSRFCNAFDRITSDWEEWGRILEVGTNDVLSFEEIEARSVKSGRRSRFQRKSSPLRVLAVDDDPVSLRILVRHLEHDGHLVVTARDGREALAVAVKTNPQVVVTDWMMPEMDGIDLCRVLRRSRSGRNLYILIITGRAEEDRVVEAFEAGANDYVVKPFKPRILSARISGGERVVRQQEKLERREKILAEKNASLQKLKRKLEEAAMTDALTELPNRRYAMRQLEREWANSLRSSLPLSVIMIDIDKFKSINDTYGHAVGDSVLQATARSIAEILREGDTCARIGGEEFLVICPQTATEGARQLAERIRGAVEANEISTGGFEGAITLSSGVATNNTSNPGSVDVLLRISDEAVYEAKRLGRNRVVVGRSPDEERRRPA